MVSIPIKETWGLTTKKKKHAEMGETMIGTHSGLSREGVFGTHCSPEKLCLRDTLHGLRSDSWRNRGWSYRYNRSGIIDQKHCVAVKGPEAEASLNSCVTLGKP